MAKILTTALRNLGSRYGALEADTGVPTINLSEGISPVHNVAPDLAAFQGRFFYYTIIQIHAAAGSLQNVTNPAGALNVLGDFPAPRAALSQRWDRREEDLYLLGAGANIAGNPGLTLTTAASFWDAFTTGPALSLGTQIPTNVQLFFGDTAQLVTNHAGGSPISEGDGPTHQGPFPMFVDRNATGVLRFVSEVSGSGAMSITYWVKAWIGPRDVVPPFA